MRLDDGRRDAWRKLKTELIEATMKAEKGDYQSSEQKEGFEVEIQDGRYTASIVGVNLNEGKLRLRTMKDGEPFVRVYSLKEIAESDLGKKEA